MLQLQEIVTIISIMKDNHVCIYGCGKNGERAIRILERAGIEIDAVSDRARHTQICGYNPIEIDELELLDDKIVCVITPHNNVEAEQDRLSRHFQTVINMEIINFLSLIPEKNKEWGWEGYAPIGAYDSPYIVQNSVEYKHYNEDKTEITDIDLRECEQINLMKNLRIYYNDFYEDINNRNFRYKDNNGFFDEADASLLYSIMRKFCPKHIIEIGSGYSTAIMLDVREYYLLDTEITCIEPYPDRLKQNMRTENEVVLYKKFLQEIDISLFDKLEEADILFIDSSHVAKLGGDILQEYFQILPRLKKGVIIHIHDIFYPFTYPEEWIKQGRCYNEAFILRALLMNNPEYKILQFNDMMYQLHFEEFREVCRHPGGSSIWLIKNM